MKKSPLVTSLAATLLTFGSLAGGTSAALVLTEINYNPPENGSDQDEYIEIYNAGSSSIDLTGYSFTSGFTFAFDSGASIASGEAILVAGNSSSLQATDIADKTALSPSQQLFYTIPVGTQVFQWSFSSLSNGGELIALADSNGTEVFRVRYDDRAPWSLETDGRGYTHEVIDPQSQSGNFATSSDATNWRRSEAIGGSPGTVSLIPEPSSALLIGLGALSFMARRRRAH